MCSFIVTNKEINDLNLVNCINKMRGPDYTNVEKLLYSITHNKEIINNLNATKKQEFINETIRCFESNTKEEISFKLITDLSKIFYK